MKRRIDSQEEKTARRIGSKKYAKDRRGKWFNEPTTYAEPPVMPTATTDAHRVAPEKHVHSEPLGKELRHIGVLATVILLLLALLSCKAQAQDSAVSKQKAIKTPTLSKTVTPPLYKIQSINGADIVVTAGTSLLLSDSATLRTDGDLSLAGNFLAADSSTVVMSGAATQQLIGGFSFGKLVKSNGGSLIMTANDTVRASLALNGGAIQTGSNVLVLHNGATNAALIGGADTSYVDGIVQRLFTITASTQLFPIGSQSRYRPLSIQAASSSATSAANARIETGDASTVSSSLGGLQRVSQLRYYRLENQPIGQPLVLSQTTVRVNDDDGVGSFNPNTTLRLATFNTGDVSWSTRALVAAPNTTVFPTTIVAVPFSVTIPASSSAPLFTSLATTVAVDNPLPVSLVSLSAASTIQGFSLEWRTGSEIESAGFVIYKRAAGASAWREVASYRQTASLRARNSLSGASYSFIDKAEVQKGERWSYRLDAADLDGTVETLKELETEALFSNIVTDYALYQNYPNPFNPTTTILYDLKARSRVRLDVFNMLGQSVARLVDGEQERGRYSVPFSGAGLASGVYFYRVQTGSLDGQGGASFVATKKMTLIK